MCTHVALPPTDGRLCECLGSVPPGAPRSETRAHFFDYMVGQLRPLERKSIEWASLGRGAMLCRRENRARDGPL